MYFYPLKFDFDLLNDPTILDRLPKITHFKIPPNKIPELISEKMLNLFKSLDLDISLLEIFYRSPGAGSGIHIDSYGGDYTKLNWIFGGKNSTMKWWTPRDSNSGKIKDTIIDTKFLLYSQDDVDLLYEYPLVSANLVQVGIPHSVVNPFEERFCFSFVYRSNNQRLTMDQSVNLFYPYIN